MNLLAEITIFLFIFLVPFREHIVGNDAFTVHFGRA